MRKFTAVSPAIVGAPGKKEEKKEKKAVVGPGLERTFAADIAESVFKRKRERKKINILKEELRLLKQLADNTANDDPSKADVLKRLGDGYKSYFDELNFLARELDEKIYQAQKQKKKKTVAKYKAQQKKLETMAREVRELAVKAYLGIHDYFPDYPDYDEIIFAIGYELDQIGNELFDDEKKAAAYKAQARKFYNELIRNHPRSRFIPHAWMAYGEYHFHEAKDADRAFRSYKKVSDWGPDENPNYVIALYYQAWCLFNLQKYQEAISQFIDVIQFADAHTEEREAAAVAKRSKLELVSPFSKIGNPSGAWQFFQRVGGDKAHAMLEKLANIYYDEGQWGSAVVVLHQLEKLEVDNYRNNNGDDLCKYQHLVTNAVINSKPKKDQLIEMQRQLGIYKRFIEEGNHDPKKLEQCAADTISMTWDQATHWHVEAVGNEKYPGTKDRVTMEVSVGLYETILNTFKNLDELEIDGFTDETRPNRYRIAYYIADLYWTMEEWRKCGPAFDQVVEMNPEGELTSEAAYGAVLCYNKVYVQERAAKDKSRDHAVDADPNGIRASCNKECMKCKKRCRGKDKEACQNKCQADTRVVLKPRDLTELEQGILRSYDRYVCFVDKGKDLVPIKYRRARIYYEANHFAEASILFKDIALNHSESDLAVFSANLHLDSLNALGDKMEVPNPACYDDLAESVDAFIDTSKPAGQNLLKDAAFASQIRALKVGVMRKQAESMTTRQRFKESAEIYLNIYRHWSGVYDDAGMCEVLFNSAINMEAARLVMPAIRVRQKMIELYPDCEHSKKAAYYIGQNYHALQVFDLAAINYYDFAKRYPGEPESEDALSSAIMFYIGLGEYEQAWEAVKKFEKLYYTKDLQKTANIFFSAGYIYLNEAQDSRRVDLWDPVRSHYKRYLKRYSSAKAIDEQVQAHVFLGDSYWKQRPRDLDRAEKEYQKALAIFADNAMDKVPENKRKAEMLNAAAKSRYNMAERKFYEFRKIRFPDFMPEREVPPHIDRWWRKKQGKEAVAQFEEMRKYRRILTVWGEMDRKEARQETKKEDASIQFEYWLEHRFKPWMDRKTAALEVANKAFAEVVNMHVPEWEMAAAARAGDMQLQFMNALYDSPLPPSFKGDEELTTIYRQSMDEKAEPFRKVAKQLYAHCLNVSTKVRWFNENSTRCETALNGLDPKKYPVSEEIRIQPDNEMLFFDVPGPILERESEEVKRDKEIASSVEDMSGKSAADIEEAVSPSSEEAGAAAPQE
jgi:hypothetical protein